MKRYDEIAGAGWSVLTARERDVIEPVAEGKSNKVIAIDLGISMRTVEAHRARIFYKMGVRNAVQLARELCTNPPQAWLQTVELPHQRANAAFLSEDRPAQPDTKQADDRRNVVRPPPEG